ncbi:potassium channel family protein [Geoalkalibacter halelectricus]|uniref:TrkA family potassium uptake protein n=1 Tax=Geoalkalibacter halelectricus TaxID=2847045 RepID=A0ABY5ZM76_9BACT|nr:TrkA family potassium uptake protein [Geoalkalibacter halelectricus]MDO3378444.1 TrkA family potassium uptake protein [Geoalkalibacter halelectricus]UWZ80236.1 TrkA family potassium uptake protein [Geoalkalibacter halelectricus]
MKRKRFGVVGLGNFGHHAARALYEEGHEVVAVDIDQDKIQRIRDYCTFAVAADAADREFLHAQGFAEMDAVVVSTGERSHLATLITLYLKELKVRNILVKAVSEDHGRILEKIGADEIIFPEKDMARKIARNLSTPNILEFVPLGEGYSITEAAPPASFIGKTLAELDLRRRHQITVIGIRDVLTGHFALLPPPDQVIKDSDLLVFIGRSEDIERVLK